MKRKSSILWLSAVVLLGGPIGCRTAAVMQEGAMPADSLSTDAVEAALEGEESLLVAPPGGLERWEVSGGLKEGTESDRSPIKPEIFDEETYWKENAKREGMVVLESGVQYLPVRNGRGLPIRNAPKVRVNYLVSRVTGQRVADSRLKNEGRPLEMEVADMPASWQEVLPEMREGDIWRVFVPADLVSDIDLPPGSYSFDIEVVRAFADVSDWYNEFSEDGGDGDGQIPDTKVLLAPETENE